MIKKIKEAIEENHLLDGGEKIIVAVSGGPDSVALLKVLEMLSDEYSLTLIVAHINHGLREEGARRRAIRTRNGCGTWGLHLRANLSTSDR